jgi:outer membrane protein assembly factor BamB
LRKKTCGAIILFASLVFLFAADVLAADWPMWRYDAGRTAASPEELPAELHLQWVRQYPPLEPAWQDEPRMEFDVVYEPIVMGKTMYVGSARNDSLTAIDTETGRELWRFYADGPVRFAPVAWQGNVYFVSDDGSLYCLDGDTGECVWKFRGGPSDRKVLGNERLISVWPARGAPVIVDGTVYFAAGIFPFEGIFIYALDAETGQVLWENEGSGSLYMLQPHNSPAFAGVAPQGYIAAVGDNLLIPGGRSVPACFDRSNGAFRYYHLAANGHLGRFDVTAARDHFFNAGAMFDLASGKNLGRISADLVTSGSTAYTVEKGAIRALNLSEATFTEISDDRGRKRTTADIPELWRLEANAEELIKSGSRLYAAGRGSVLAVDVPGGSGGGPKVSWRTTVKGTPTRLLAANEKLFAVTREGRIYCFGGKRTRPRIDRTRARKRLFPSFRWRNVALDVMRTTGVREGYCLMWGVGSGRLLEELARRSEVRIIAVDPDPNKVSAVRRHLDEAGLYGTRAVVHVGDPLSFAFPPYLADLIVCEEPDKLVPRLDSTSVKTLFHPLRPYGGVACLFADKVDQETLRKAAEDADLMNADIKRAGKFMLLTRVGALPGSADWTHQYANAANTGVSKDALVKAPLGLLWFGGSSNKDILPRHGHGPSEQVVGGRLFIEGPDMIRALDVYTGRVLWEASLPDVGKAYNNTSHQPGANALGSNYVSVDDGIYVAYGETCIRLDPATGEKLSEFQLPPAADAKEQPIWGRIGVCDDLLLAASDPIVFDDKTRGYTWNAVASKRLVIMNRYTGDVLWMRDAEHGFRHNAIAIGGGKVFCIDALTQAMLERMKRRGRESEVEGTLYALDVRDGAEVWRTKDDVFGTWLGYSEEYDILLQAGRPSRDMLNDEPGNRLIAYRGGDGTVLWNKAVKYGGPCLLHHDTLITQGEAFSLLTGEQIMRRHALTGAMIPWQFSRNYGCNTAIASEHLLTFRSAAAGYFNLDNDGGTANLGGFKSGCTSNLIVANGVLSAPDYTRTCTCSYQNQTSLAFVHVPDVEIWSFNSFKAGDEPVNRVGINFGAPGDRRVGSGTLWLDYPSVGGPSPDIPVRTVPEEPEWFRRHSSRIQGESLKWVGASGAKGIRSVTLTLAPGAETERSYTVRLHFVEPDDLRTGERVFDVAIQGQPVLAGFDVVKEAGARLRAVVKEFRGVKVKEDLTVTFAGSQSGTVHAPVICGVEVVAEEG